MPYSRSRAALASRSVRVPATPVVNCTGLVALPLLPACAALRQPQQGGGIAPVDFELELSPNLGDGRDQAAAA
jgi:hypothetical protein